MSNRRYTEEFKIEAVLYDIAEQTGPVYAVDVETEYQADGNSTDWVIATRIAEAIANKLQGARMVKRR